MLTTRPSSSDSLGLPVASLLHGPHGDQERQSLLKQLHEIQDRLLSHTKGEGAGSAWVNDLDSESLKMAQTALASVRHAIDILNQVDI